LKRINVTKKMKLFIWLVHF